VGQQSSAQPVRQRRRLPPEPLAAHAGRGVACGRGARGCGPLGQPVGRSDAAAVPHADRRRAVQRECLRAEYQAAAGGRGRVRGIRRLARTPAANDRINVSPFGERQKGGVNRAKSDPGAELPRCAKKVRKNRKVVLTRRQWSKQVRRFRGSGPGHPCEWGRAMTASGAPRTRSSHRPCPRSVIGGGRIDPSAGRPESSASAAVEEDQLDVAVAVQVEVQVVPAAKSATRRARTRSSDHHADPPAPPRRPRPQGRHVLARYCMFLPEACPSNWACPRCWPSGSDGSSGELPNGRSATVFRSCSRDRR